MSNINLSVLQRSRELANEKIVFPVTKEDLVFCIEYVDKSDRAYSNLKCLFDIAQAEWKKLENKLTKENQSLLYQLDDVKTLPSNSELLEDKLKDAEELHVKLKHDYENMKEKNGALESLCKELQKKVKLLEEYEGVQNKALTLSIANTPSTSSNVFPPSGNDTYIVQLQTKLDRIKKDVKFLSKSLEMAQENLRKEEEKVKQISKEKELLTKENMDYKRQVKELENIVYKRSRNDSSIFSETRHSSLPRSQDREYVKKLRDQLEEKNDTVVGLKNDLTLYRDKYENHIKTLKSDLAVARLEIWKLKEESNRRGIIVNDAPSPRKCRRSQQNTSLATTYKKTCSSEMEILHLRNQEIEVHNDNELLTKEKEKCLQLYESLFSVQNDNGGIQKYGASVTMNSYNGHNSDDDSDSPLLTDNFDVNKDKLSEIRNKIGKLENELSTLERGGQNKSAGQVERSYSQSSFDHCHQESTNITNLQRQLNTQNIIINYLNEQMEGTKSDGADTRARTVHDRPAVAMPSTSGITTGTEKLSGKTVVGTHDLKGNKKSPDNAVCKQVSCPNQCQQKIFQKNLQICHYKNELDRIIQVLSEFKKTNR